MCSERQYGSTDMPHGLFGSGHDLDFDLDDPLDIAPRHNMNVVSLLSQELLMKNLFRKKTTIF